MPQFSTLQLILLIPYLLFNVIAFVYVYFDKMKALGNSRRIPEWHLMFWAICFGALGVFVGMIIMRHKIRKIQFVVGVPLALIQNLAVLGITWQFLAKIQIVF